MTYRPIWRMTALPLSAMGMMLASPALAHKAGDPIPNSYICTFVPGPSTGSYEAHAAVAKVGGQITHLYSHVINGFAARLNERAVQTLMARNPHINYCEQDSFVTVPDSEDTAMAAIGRPGGGGGTTQTTPWGVTRVGGTRSGAGKRVWVVDSGVGPHSDLNIDANLSRSFLSTDPLGNPASFNDYLGHGTHVSGTIAAINNSIGVVGVAAGATVISVRVLDATGSGPDSGVLAGLDYIATNAPAAGEVINISLIADSNIFDSAVINLGNSGINVVIAAGNNGAPAINYSPGKVDAPNVYTVSAFDNRDRLASFSNYGNPPIDFSEPGVNISSLDKNNGYSTKSGTSMAAPHLSGILLVAGHANSGGAIKADKDATPDTIGVLP